jgi:phosphoribosylformylglycinamidine synthase I
MKPIAAIIIGNGINCDYELQEAFRLAGAEAERIHLNDLLKGADMEHYDIIGLPGGFSFGDDTFAGNILAKKIIHSELKRKFVHHLDKGGLIFGACNGNQIGPVMNLIPAFGEVLGEPEIAYTNNDSARYEDRGNINLKVVSEKSHWLKEIKQLNNIPVGHGEGKFYAEDAVIRELYRLDIVALKYCRADGKLADGKYPANPNGSIDDIAGLATEQVLLMMPHPERAIRSYNQDGWTRRKSLLKREGMKLPEEGDGMKIIRNGVDYFLRKI